MTSRWKYLVYNSKKPILHVLFQVPLSPPARKVTFAVCPTFIVEDSGRGSSSSGDSLEEGEHLLSYPEGGRGEERAVPQPPSQGRLSDKDSDPVEGRKTTSPSSDTVLSSPHLSSKRNLRDRGRPVPVSSQTRVTDRDRPGKWAGAEVTISKSGLSAFKDSHSKLGGEQRRLEGRKTEIPSIPPNERILLEGEGSDEDDYCYAYSDSISPALLLLRGEQDDNEDIYEEIADNHPPSQRVPDSSLKPAEDITDPLQDISRGRREQLQLYR